MICGLAVGTRKAGSQQFQIPKACEPGWHDNICYAWLALGAGVSWRDSVSTSVSHSYDFSGF